MIKFKSSGDWRKTAAFLRKKRSRKIRLCLETYGAQGVSALSDATPRDTGKTAASWSYKASVNKNGARLEFLNDNVQDGAVVALIIQYGHAAPNGYWIEGLDYIGPALAPILENLADEVWREITK